jgi:hypothetical protein
MQHRLSLTLAAPFPQNSVLETRLRPQNKWELAATPQVPLLQVTNWFGFKMREMKPGPTRTAMRFGTIVCVVGFVPYGIAFALAWFAEATTAAIPFLAVGFYLSLPSVLLAGDPFGNPFWAYLLPATLVLNAILLSIVVWTFLRLKIIVDAKIYGIEESQQPHPEATSNPAPFQGAGSEASDA